MSQKIIFRAGEATVFAAEGQYTDAMPEILIGAVDGPKKSRVEVSVAVNNPRSAWGLR